MHVTSAPSSLSAPPAPLESAASAPPAASSGGITPAQLQELAAARRRCRKITRAAGVAAFSGWTLGFFAAISLLGGLFSLRALILGIGMSAVAFVELKGSKGLRAFDLSAPVRLAFNQIGLVAVITVYAGWGILEATHAPGAYDEYIATGGQMAEMLQPIDDMTRAVTIAVGIALIIGSGIAQTCAAIYYFTRRRHIVAFKDATPDWVLQAITASS